MSKKYDNNVSIHEIFVALFFEMIHLYFRGQKKIVDYHFLIADSLNLTYSWNQTKTDVTIILQCLQCDLKGVVDVSFTSTQVLIETSSKCKLQKK